MASSVIELEKKRLEEDLAARKQDYEGVANKLRWETEPTEQNSLQAKQDKLIDEIKKLEQLLKALKTSSQTDSQTEIITILKPYYKGKKKVQIQQAYILSLPVRLIDKELPSSLEDLIKGLQWPQQKENYSCLEKFVGNLVLDQNLTIELKQKLNEWATEYINDKDNDKERCQKLLEQLCQEREQREQQCYPVLLVAISERKGSYVVEAWLIKNIDQYEPCYSSECEQLTINQQSEIATDETLNNVPELLKNLIAQSFDKCQKYLKQIHIFLPSKFMNYAVDWWQNWQENEDKEYNYSSIIGEDYEVLLRCSERLRGKSPPVFKWREKGYILKSKLTQPAKKIFVLGDSNNWKTLLKQLRQDEKVIAVTITTVFQQKQLGKILWQSAVPLALWIRQQLPQIENQSVLDDILKDCCLKEVPKQVKMKRLDAFDCESPENHVGRHLCLLWDDPNLLPPEQLLTQTNL